VVFSFQKKSIYLSFGLQQEALSESTDLKLPLSDPIPILKIYKKFDKQMLMDYHASAMMCIFNSLVFLLSLVILGSIWHPAQVLAKDPDYLWPLPRIRSLSSVFAEYRHFRFHSGIDIPTQGETGYHVLACESGYVYRVFTSWDGYGKAIYLKLDDGRFAVYGHLSGFSESIANLVEKEQIKNERYYTDIFPKGDMIRVKRGELIAYSGESGWGGPHLHFELRDPEGNPINPLFSGYRVEDIIPPVMSYVALRPLTMESRVDGSTETIILPLSYNSPNGTFTPVRIPVVEGEIGLEISVYDKMDKSVFRLGVFSLELYLDDSLLFASRYDRISFETTHQVELDRDFELRQTKGKDFYKLYVEEENTLPLYDPAEGRLNTRNMDPDSHRVAIKAFDASGNVSVARFPLIFDHQPVILSSSAENLNGITAIRVFFEDPDDSVREILLERFASEDSEWEILKREIMDKQQGEALISLGENGRLPILLRTRLKDSFGVFSKAEYLMINPVLETESGSKDSLSMDLEYEFKDNLIIFDLKFNQLQNGMPELSLQSGEFTFDLLFLEQTDVMGYRATFPFYLKNQKEMVLSARVSNIYGDALTLQKTIPVAIFTPSLGGVAASFDGQAEMEMGSGVVYHDINVTIGFTEFKSEKVKKPLSKLYSFQPSTVPFNGRAKISIDFPCEGTDPRRLGLYEWTAEGSWNYVGQDLDSLNCSIAGMVRYLSTYALLEDTLPPTIEKISVRPGSILKQKRPVITALFYDDLSGIGGDQDVRMDIDGEWMIPEYDVDTKILSTRPINPLTEGKHVLTIWGRDRAGNEIKVKRSFSVQSQ
jgi:hypothetical protein